MTNVFEPDLQEAVRGAQHPHKGQWHKEVFGNDHPITLELGCGKGEYTVELARQWPQRNFVGVDIKGHRFWRGAKTANQESLSNVAFLRTRIEFIDQFFAPGEVERIWLTFSDPQPKDEKGTKASLQANSSNATASFWSQEGPSASSPTASCFMPCPKKITSRRAIPSCTILKMYTADS